MAMALEKDPLKATEQLEKLSEASLAFIKEALTLEETGNQISALLHYEEGLHLLDRALDLPQHDPRSTEVEQATASKTRVKMSRTRQQIIFRIREIRNRDIQGQQAPPPSYEETQVEDALQDISQNDDSSDEICQLPSDAEILFTIAGRVQIFYINANGNVSAPSYPSTLHIFRFRNNDTTHAVEQQQPTPSFLQVGTWIYPLIPGKSPILKSNDGAYLFPDIDESIEGNAIGLILSADILDVEKQQFEAVIEQLTHKDDLKNYDECIEYSTQVSAGLVKGAEVVGRGMVKGAVKSSEWMYLGADKLKKSIVPEGIPTPVDPRLQTSLEAAQWVTSKTVKASGYLVSKAGTATVALGRFLAPHIKKQSTKALSHIIEQSDERSQKQVTIVSELAGGTLTALSTVYVALENSSKILATNVANNTVQVVSHKYGNQVGVATEQAFSTVGNTYLTAYNTAALGPKALAKRAAKTTGKLSVGVPEEVILGQPVDMDQPVDVTPTLKNNIQEHSEKAIEYSSKK